MQTAGLPLRCRTSLSWVVFRLAVVTIKLVYRIYDYLHDLLFSAAKSYTTGPKLRWSERLGKTFQWDHVSNFLNVSS